MTRLLFEVEVGYIIAFPCFVSRRWVWCAQTDMLERTCDQLVQLDPHRQTMLSFGRDKLLSLRGSASTVDPALRYTLDQRYSWRPCGWYVRPRGRRAGSRVQRSITTVSRVLEKTASRDHNINATISNNLSSLWAVGITSALTVVSPSLTVVSP